MKEDILRKKETLDETKRYRAEAEARATKLDSELSEATKELTRVKVKLEANLKKDEQLKAYRESANSLKAERDALKLEQEATKTQLSDLKSEITRKDTIISKLKESSKSGKELEENLEKHTIQLQDLKSQVKKFKSDLERKDTVISSLTNKLKDAESKVLDEKNRLELELKSTKVGGPDFRRM